MDQMDYFTFGIRDRMLLICLVGLLVVTVVVATAWAVSLCVSRWTWIDEQLLCWNDLLFVSREQVVSGSLGNKVYTLHGTGDPRRGWR